jgi:GNAT superfamily N-acetyltransferase
MGVEFRAGELGDFDFCRRLYFAQLAEVSPEQEASFLERWVVGEVRVITCDGAEVGWLQSRMEHGSLFLVQLFVESGFQGRGIGTEVLKRLMSEASEAGVPMTLGVVKSNPARRLYERLGFAITHEDDRKFYTKWEPDKF